MSSLAEACELSIQNPEVLKKLEAFQRSFDQRVVGAIIRDAMSTTGAADRTLLLVASDLMEYWHASSPLVRSARQGVSGRDQPPATAFHPDEWKQRLSRIVPRHLVHRTEWGLVRGPHRREPPRVR